MTEQPSPEVEPDPPERSLDAPAAAEGPEGPEAPEGYRNLWVPLIVVPFLVVGVIALVFVFFGAIRGRDATLEENLSAMVSGGTNERKQATISLVAQVLENEQMLREGKQAPWEVGDEFLGSLQQAWEDTAQEENLNLRLALARVLAHYGDPDVRAKLESLLAVPDEDDADGQVRFGALEALAVLADPAAAPAVIPFLDHPDSYLRMGAAAALQALPGDDTVTALRGMLGDPDLALRGMAAISLSHLGDDAGHTVLLDLVDQATYEAIKSEDSSKYNDPNLIQNNRIRALQALARLGHPADLALFTSLADGEADLRVREAAMRARDALAAAGPDSGGDRQ